MFLKTGLLAVVGFCGGSMVAAGLFAFLTAIGVLMRLVGRTHTARSARLYEDWVILGAGLGNAAQQFSWKLPGNAFALGVFGLGSGIFVGCLIMSLAETLDAVPVMGRRLHLSVGLQYLVLSLAIGKCAGAFLDIVM